MGFFFQNRNGHNNNFLSAHLPTLPDWKLWQIPGQLFTACENRVQQLCDITRESDSCFNYKFINNLKPDKSSNIF